jgi:Flp pilus assembly protein CpaB
MKTRIIGAIVALVLAGIGAFVLIAYVRGADARAAEGAEMADVYVVQDLIPKGTSGDTVADYVEVDSVPQRNIADGAVTDLDDLAGLIAAADILPGEQLLEARFADPADLAAQGDVQVPEGMQLVSFTLPADRVVGGEIRAGDRIGMVGTVDPAEPSEAEEVINPITQFAFNGVLVTRVEGVSVADASEDETDPAQDPTAGIMLTIALSTHDIERWVWFTEGEDHDYANMWLTLQLESTDTGGSSTVDLGNVFP